jgi:hypothetical protein
LEWRLRAGNTVNITNGVNAIVGKKHFAVIRVLKCEWSVSRAWALCSFIVMQLGTVPQDSCTEVWVERLQSLRPPWLHCHAAGCVFSRFVYWNVSGVSPELEPSVASLSCSWVRFLKIHVLKCEWSVYRAWALRGFIVM